MVSNGGNEGGWREYLEAARRRVTPSKTTIVLLLLGVVLLESLLFFAPQIAADKEYNNGTISNRPATAINNNPTAFYVGLPLRFEEWAGINHDMIEAVAAISSILFSALLFGSNILLWFATKANAEAAAVAVEIAEKALVDYERPWIVIQSVKVVRRDPPPAPNRWYISFEGKNIGRMPAQIKSIVAVLLDIDLLPDKPDYANGMPLTAQVFIPVNEPFQTNAFGPGGNATKDGNPIRFVVFGKIAYAGLGGGNHLTGFCFEVSAHLPLASAHHKEGYEYHT